MQRVKLKNIQAYSFSSRKELIDLAIKEKKILIAINAEKILKKDVELQEIINNNIGYPDGVGAVWALKKKGFKKTIKIPGVELWLDIIKELHKEKSFYFIGSSDEVISMTVEKLKHDFPDINILNFRNGFIKTEEDKLNLKNDILEKKPDIVFVAMGTPKQEFLMNELLSFHSALYQGLGGSFDVYSGKVKRAPKIFIKLGVEWLYRLLKEPTRIKRQIVLVKFFWLLQTGKI
ncbi:MAG: glycosyl transferase [Bacteroidetes bacterium GWA2_31_9]|nr:MAG: glycosyl transferase [Bacteroidetes bacterium GWA2_31_9]